MKILITGSTGFIGNDLGIELARLGHDLVCLVRSAQEAKKLCPFPATFLEWDYHSPLPAELNIMSLDSVIHLMGAPISGPKWTSSYKQELCDSRILSAQKLAHFAAESGIKTFISASAIGFYGDRKEEELDETSSKGSGFLSDLCQQWENEVLTFSKNLRVVCLRIGVVLDKHGGALKTMLPFFRKHLGGKVGSGKQWISWIHKQDLIQMILFALKDESLSGVYNATSPNPVRQSQFSTLLAKKLGVTSLFPTPKLLLQLIYGEMSSLVTDSIKVLPKKILKTSFQFKFESLEDCFEDLFNNLDTYEHEYVSKQYIPRNLEEVFPFFADENNLEQITPPFLNFKVLEKTTKNMEAGTLIDYRLKLYGIPFYWRTKILHWNPPHDFSDLQMKGPYKKWHHTHSFEPLGQGTLMVDVVHYKLPLGFLGDIFGGWKVTRDVNQIFNYRREIMNKLFV